MPPAPPTEPLHPSASGLNSRARQPKHDGGDPMDAADASSKEADATPPAEGGVLQVEMCGACEGSGQQVVDGQDRECLACDGRGVVAAPATNSGLTWAILAFSMPCHDECSPGLWWCGECDELSIGPVCLFCRNGWIGAGKPLPGRVLRAGAR
jgi:hypothetical protein